jgi:hypothetical protein
MKQFRPIMAEFQQLKQEMLALQQAEKPSSNLDAKTWLSDRIDRLFDLKDKLYEKRKSDQGAVFAQRKAAGRRFPSEALGWVLGGVVAAASAPYIFAALAGATFTVAAGHLIVTGVLALTAGTVAGAVGYAGLQGMNVKDQASAEDKVLHAYEGLASEVEHAIAGLSRCTASAGLQDKFNQRAAASEMRAQTNRLKEDLAEAREIAQDAQNRATVATGNAAALAGLAAVFRFR